MRFVLPLLLMACGTDVSEGDDCDVGGDTTRSDGIHLVCQCNDASAPTGPCNGTGQWIARDTITESGPSCDEGGARDCDGEITRMCLCDGDDPFARDCPEDGEWTVQTTLCDTCDDWLDDTCPIE